jgi:hypothetical protein
MPRQAIAELPTSDDGTVAALATAGSGPPHAIAVSTAVRAGPHTVLLALALQRESLARLRADPRVALTVMARDVACTARATAVVVQDPMEASDRVAAVRLDVDEIQDDRQHSFVVEAGVRWRWTDPEAEQRDREIRRRCARSDEPRRRRPL